MRLESKASPGRPPLAHAPLSPQRAKHDRQRRHRCVRHTERGDRKGGNVSGLPYIRKQEKWHELVFNPPIALGSASTKVTIFCLFVPQEPAVLQIYGYFGLGLLSPRGFFKLPASALNQMQLRHLLPTPREIQGLLTSRQQMARETSLMCMILSTISRHQSTCKPR